MEVTVLLVHTGTNTPQQTLAFYVQRVILALGTQPCPLNVPQENTPKQVNLPALTGASPSPVQIILIQKTELPFVSRARKVTHVTRPVLPQQLAPTMSIPRLEKWVAQHARPTMFVLQEAYRIAAKQTRKSWTAGRFDTAQRKRLLSFTPFAPMVTHVILPTSQFLCASLGHIPMAEIAIFVQPEICVLIQKWALQFRARRDTSKMKLVQLGVKNVQPANAARQTRRVTAQKENIPTSEI